jgi:hypothetical protein
VFFNSSSADINSTRSVSAATQDPAGNTADANRARNDATSALSESPNMTSYYRTHVRSGNLFPVLWMATRRTEITLRGRGRPSQCEDENDC